MMELTKEERKKWSEYYTSVIKDYKGLKEQYPFSSLLIPPTVNPSFVLLHVVAANLDLIQNVMGTEEDFIGEYSKVLYVEVPVDYKKNGCNVYGANWIDVKKIKEQDVHFYTRERKEFYGYKLCVGTPESFPLMPNVLLENIRTAERMLIAYEQFMRGEIDKLNLIAYAHGDMGRKQFDRNRSKYNPERKK
ncbi:hypothetical protein [Eubacterium sp.]|uniref:hypothetical protein n=1 Tax=Eubacterium sp. TaxID=142586 RepID=UPI0025D1A6BB|nr:hypothetical protein [Eubacterium sp.]MCR5629592.1 hypothetical protein [Eubacterium sp.]